MVCSFGLRACPPRSAAFTVVFGHAEPKEVWAKMVERASATSVPGVTVYCKKCRFIRAVSTQTDATDALVSHEVEWNAWNVSP